MTASAGAATKESHVAHAASYIARFPPLSSGTFGNDARKCCVSLKGEGSSSMCFFLQFAAALCLPVFKLLLGCLRDLPEFVQALCLRKRDVATAFELRTQTFTSLS